jgi:hypothetical protein
MDLLSAETNQRLDAGRRGWVQMDVYGKGQPMYGSAWAANPTTVSYEVDINGPFCPLLYGAANWLGFQV